MNTSKTCQFEGCPLANIARGYCGKHYQQLKRSGKLKKLKPEELNQDKKNGIWYECSACRRKFYRTPSEISYRVGQYGQYCSLNCWYKRNKDLKCLVTNCNRSRVGRGYCRKHYRRLLRYGDPLKTIIESPWSPNIKGYRKLKRNGINIPEHRYVAEQILGRRLSSIESIHHLDGNRLNNKPENLMLFKTLSAHRQYENRYREYLEQCLREGILKFVKTPLPFKDSGIKLSKIKKS